jgi:hypothetical protein
MERRVVMWWILQIVGCLSICVVNIVNRKYGVCLTSWVVYTLIAASVMYLAFSKSYAIAPTFFGAWFIGQTSLAVLGLVVSFLVFKDAVSTTQWVGLVLSIVGGYLIIK